MSKLKILYYNWIDFEDERQRRGGVSITQRNCRELVFQAGSRADFYAKLRGILDDPTILSIALAGRAHLYTTREHYDLLREHYYHGETAKSPSFSHVVFANHL